MPAYAFETITPEQALAVRAGDTLTFNGGPGRTVSVGYQSFDPLALTAEPARIILTYEGRSVVFGTDLVQIAKSGGLVMADGSKLYVGDADDDRFTGGAGEDGLYGGPSADTLSGGAGRDVIQGNSGGDLLLGGEGGDSVYGGQGDDTIFTSRDASGVTGGPGEGDWANGNLGNDSLVGGAGGDTLLGGQGADFVAGGDGDDYVSGDLGDDELTGGMGSDTLVGGGGQDRLEGAFGADLLNGGDGDDRLATQGPEATVLNGGAGNDTISSFGAARDTISGGEALDHFVFVSATAPSVDVEAVIVDWEAHDILQFNAAGILSPPSIRPSSYSEVVASDYAEALSMANEQISAAGAVHVVAQVGADLYVFADTGDPADGADIAILLVGRTLADITIGNIV